jgi:hypothetical protein
MAPRKNKGLLSPHRRDSGRMAEEFKQYKTTIWLKHSAIIINVLYI